MKNLGLAQAVRALAESEAARGGLALDLKIDSMHEQNRDVEHAVYRIAAEALANVVRHAQARSVTVKLEQGRLLVADDGRGFDPAAPLDEGRFGLYGMRERGAYDRRRARDRKRPGKGQHGAADGAGTMIRVLICDDQQVVCEGLRAILSTAPQIEVVGLAHHGADALERIPATRPDVVLMDLKMPVMNGVQATREIRVRFPGVRVLVLTTYDADQWVLDAVRAGASGYLLKDSPATR